MRYILAIVAILSILAPHAEAAEGRRTAFAGGLVVGLVGGFLARDAMEVKPAPQVVYVERQPRVVYVEHPPVYVAPAPTVVYVNVEIRSEHRCEHRAWQPPIAHPFPQ